MSGVDFISVNRRAAELTAALRRDAAMLNLGIARGPRGELLIDAGAKHRGGVEAGLRIAEICLSGLGSVRLTPGSATPAGPGRLRSPRRSPSSRAWAANMLAGALLTGPARTHFLLSAPAQLGRWRKRKRFSRTSAIGTKPMSPRLSSKAGVRRRPKLWTKWPAIAAWRLHL